MNGWQDREKLLWLRVRLVGRAATAFRRVDDGARGSYTDCIEALKEQFDLHSKHELYLAELLAWKKRRSEDWAMFAEDLKLLVDKAYPELQDNAREQLALTHYLGQLEQPQLAFSVKQRRPRTVDEVVRTTLEMESYLLPKSTRVARVEESQHSPAIGAINCSQPDFGADSKSDQQFGGQARKFNQRAFIIAEADTVRWTKGKRKPDPNRECKQMSSLRKTWASSKRVLSP